MIESRSAQSFERIKALPSWVWLYFGVLVFLLFWGVFSTGVLPVAEVNAGPVDLLEYERYAPGWAGRGAARKILSPWLRWDTVWYLAIAAEGYQVDQAAVAFPPLYPHLIRLVGKILGGQYLIGSLLISWAACFGACALLAEKPGNQPEGVSAASVVRSMLFFPTAFFLFAGYTEALFLVLVLLGWRYADRGKWELVGLLGAAAILTRFVGVLLVVPFGLIWLDQFRKGKIRFWHALWLLPMPAAYFGWGWFTEYVYGLSPSSAMHVNWAQHYDLPWVGLFGSIEAITTRPIAEVFFAYIDVLVVIVVAGAAIKLLREKRLPEGSYLLAVLLISLVKVSNRGMLASAGRFMLPLFPLYLILPKWLTDPIVRRVVLYGSAFLWVMSATMFFTWNWIA